MPDPTVAVWNNEWLGLSETFIRDHAKYLSRYRAIRVGLRRQEDPLVEPEVLVGRAGLRGRIDLWSLPRGRIPRGPRRQLRRSSVSIVHGHYGTTAVMAAGLARGLRVPLVVTYHGFDVTSFATGDTPEVERYVAELQKGFEAAARLIAVSRHIAARLIALGAPPEKVLVRHLGVSIPASAAPWDARGEFILFVGRFVEKKGLSELLDALGLLRTGGRQAELRVIGTGPLDEGLRRKSRDLGLEVKFLGERGSGEVHAMMREAAVVVVPSRTAADGDTEGLPIVLLEAASHGTPVVAFATAGIPDAITDGIDGILVPEGDVAALATALDVALRDRVLAFRLGVAARRRMVADFDIVTRTRLLETIYDEVTAERDAGSSQKNV